MKKIVFNIAFFTVISANAGAVIAATDNISRPALQNDYKKIDVMAVLADVLRQVTDKYEGYSVSEAWVSEENEYRLVLNKEAKNLVVYYKSTGDFIKEEVK